MGWSFRKSFSFGPLRVNLSKSGVGFSFGMPGLRAGVSSRGRKYVSAGIPGTGVRYYKSTKSLSDFVGKEILGKDQAEPKQTSPPRKLKKKESFW